MTINKFEDRESWLSARRGKITGTRLQDLIVSSAFTKPLIMEELTACGIDFDKKGTKESLSVLLSPLSRANLTSKAPKKIGYYELIAERLAIPPDDENCMDRGTRLEDEAIAYFTADTGKDVCADLVIWEREDNSSIAISPDGYIGMDEAVEIKCLGSARHIEALLTESIPKDYEEQVIQYFIVNDNLKTLHFIFYDPRLLAKPYFKFVVNRADVQEKVTEYIELERKTIEEIDEIVLKLSDF